MGEPRGGSAKRSGAPLRAKARFWRAAEGAASTTARNGAAYGTREPPTSPVWHAAGARTQRGACDLHAKQLTGMSDDEVADPLG